MTKEERKEYIKGWYSPIVWGKLDNLVDEIYDDFENRSCESCKYCGYCETSWLGASNFKKRMKTKYIPIDFCCNRWEKKK